MIRERSEEEIRSQAGDGATTGAATERRATRVPPPWFVSIHPSRFSNWSAWWTVARFTSSDRASSRDAGRRAPSWYRLLRMSRIRASAMVR